MDIAGKLTLITLSSTDIPPCLMEIRYQTLSRIKRFVFIHYLYLLTGFIFKVNHVIIFSRKILKFYS